MSQSYTTKLPSVVWKLGNWKDRRAACLLLNSSSSSCPHVMMDVPLLNQNGPSPLSIKASIKWRGPLMAKQARTQYSTLHLPYWLWFLVEMWKLFFFGLHWQMTVCFHHLVSQQLCLIHTHLSQPINRSRFLVGLSIESSNHKSISLDFSTGGNGFGCDMNYSQWSQRNTHRIGAEFKERERENRREKTHLESLHWVFQAASWSNLESGPL